MAENNRCLVASSTFDVHEVAVRSGDQSFKFVGLSLLIKSGVKNISFHGEKLIDNKKYYLSKSIFKWEFKLLLIKEYFFVSLSHFLPQSYTPLPHFASLVSLSLIKIRLSSLKAV
jgi:hypothetical protein